MAVDASELAIGASLFQVVENVKHPICFYSKNQKRYSTIVRQCGFSASTLVRNQWKFSQTTIFFISFNEWPITIRNCYVGVQNYNSTTWKFATERVVTIWCQTAKSATLCFVITLFMSLPSSRFAYACILLYKCAFATQFVTVSSTLCTRTILLSLLFSENLFDFALFQYTIAYLVLMINIVIVITLVNSVLYRHLFALVRGSR